MRVLLGMSGGVDSSVAAILLKNQGYEVIGATMKLWEDDKCGLESGCCALSAVYDAKRVCDLLDIPHYTLAMQEEFKEYVIDDFIGCYQRAETPNPCVECNKYLKFNCFYHKAIELGCDYIATGHYAKTEFDETLKEYVLKKSNSEKKDQSYALYNMPKEIVSKVLFPLGEFKEKEEIRKIAQENGLKVARKPDSQEICFIPDNDYGRFLLENIEKPKEGNIVTKTGEILGRHKGLIYYTVGQRKGIGVASKMPLYVIELNKEKNEVVVGEEKDIYKKELYASHLNFLLDSAEKTMNINAKIRYSAKEAPAVMEKVGEDLVKVTFNDPQRAITPGQSVVFYKQDIVIGGGKIINKGE